MKIDLDDILIAKIYITKLEGIFAIIDLLLIGQNSLSESILTPYQS